MKFAAVFDLAIVVVFLPDFDDEIVGFQVFEAYKIQLIWIRLARMPYLIQVRFDSHCPAEYQGIEI